MGVLKAVVFEHAKAKNMMKYKIQFTKLVAAGNDFVLIDNRNYRINSLGLAGLAMRMCQRKYGAGADGLLVVERSPKADLKCVFLTRTAQRQRCAATAQDVLPSIAHTYLANPLPRLKLKLWPAQY